MISLGCETKLKLQWSLANIHVSDRLQISQYKLVPRQLLLSVWNRLSNTSKFWSWMSSTLGSSLHIHLKVSKQTTGEFSTNFLLFSYGVVLPRHARVGRGGYLFWWRGAQMPFTPLMTTSSITDHTTNQGNGNDVRNWKSAGFFKIHFYLLIS